MSSLHRVCGGVLVAVALSVPAYGQRTAPTAPTPDDWGHGTTLSASLGVATDSSDTGLTAGGAIGWELDPRVMLEGSALWLDRRGGADGFNAALKVRAGLTRSGVSPFLEAGVGLYRVSTKAPDEMPLFYRRRMAAHGAARMPGSFTDPVFDVGGGLNVFMSRHLALQPAVEAMFVTRDSEVHTVAVFSVRLAYHFENHPVTR